MDLSKMSIKKIRELIVFTALLVVALWKFDVVLGVLKTIWDIIFPFVLGGAIAFLTNVPMSFLEKKIFEKIKNDGMKGKEASILALMVVVASMVAMIAVICVKSVSVLFKLNKALDLYIKEQKYRHEKEMMMDHLYHDYDDEEDMSL